MVRAFKYRFYPTEEQKVLLARSFGSVRVVYNKALALKTETYKETKKGLSFAKTCKVLTDWKKQEDLKWLKEVSSTALQQSLRNLNTAFKNFFKGGAKYPKFKKKTSKQSITLTRDAFRWKNGQLFVAKSKIPLDIHWSREFQGQPSSITISKDPSNRYFVSILVDNPVQKLEPSSTKVGIDLGLTTFATLSTGEKILSPKALKVYESRLSRSQRLVSKKKIGGKNREKARLKVAKTHAKIADTRKDFHHKLSTKLVRENQVLCVESLLIKNMVRNRKLAKDISDAGWGQFLNFLKYKCEWYGRQLIGASSSYPSTKRCSHCGHTLAELDLKIREWVCPECRTEHDRDINAALNILAVGHTVTAFGENSLCISNDVSCFQ